MPLEIPQTIACSSVFVLYLTAFNIVFICSLLFFGVLYYGVFSFACSLAVNTDGWIQPLSQQGQGRPTSCALRGTTHSLRATGFQAAHENGSSKGICMSSLGLCSRSKPHAQTVTMCVCVYGMCVCESDVALYQGEDVYLYA